MKSDFTIELIRTKHGYSIIQNDIAINKTEIIHPIINNIANLNTNTINTSVSKQIKQKQKQKIPPIIKKFIPQQNFTIYPFINTKQVDNHKYIILPSKTEWFNINFIHQIQKKQLPQWFKLKKGVSAAINLMKFEKNQELYKKYRNHIIELGKTQYVTPLMSRKGLAGDACSIIRIHKFLQKWGLINFVHQKQSQKKSISSQLSQIQSNIQKSKPQFLKRKDCFDKDKTLLNKNYNKDQLQLLKKITIKFRPICNMCQGICGIVWYQYKQKLKMKQFLQNQQTKTKTVESCQKDFQYDLRICFSCYSQKNFPFILHFDDFKKKSLTQKIQIFDGTQNKKQQFIKIVQTIQKNKFNIKKSTQILKIQQKQLLNTLMQIPVINIQNFSRVQPDTDDQTFIYQNNIQIQNHQKDSHIYQKQNKIITQQAQQSQIQQDLKIFKKNMNNLQIQEKKYYEEFLQCWMLKIYSKLEQLKDWDKSVQWKCQDNQTVKKYNIVEKLKKHVKFN